MATRNFKAVPVLSPNQHSRQQQRITPISMSSLPHRSDPNSDPCRLVVDGRVFWALEPIDDSMTWMVLPRSVHARLLAGCLVITAD